MVYPIKIKVTSQNLYVAAVMVNMALLYTNCLEEWQWHENKAETR